MIKNSRNNIKKIAPSNNVTNIFNELINMGSGCGIHAIINDYAKYKKVVRFQNKDLGWELSDPFDSPIMELFSDKIAILCFNSTAYRFGISIYKISENLCISDLERIIYATKTSYNIHNILQTYTIQPLCLSKIDNSTLAVGYIDASIRIWNIDDGQLVRWVAGNIYDFAIIVLRVLGNTIYSIDENGEIYKGSTTTNENLPIAKPLYKRPIDMHIVGDDIVVLSVKNYGEIQILSKGEWSIVKVVENIEYSTIESMVKVTDSIIALLTDSALVCIYNVLTRNSLNNINIRPSPKNSLTMFGNHILISKSNGSKKLYLWDIDTGAFIQSIGPENGRLKSILIVRDKIIALYRDKYSSTFIVWA